MQYEEITSRDNARVKRAVKLAASGAYRAEEGLFFAEGVRLCLDLAQTQPPQAVFFTEKVMQSHPQVQTLGQENYLVQPHVAEKLSATKTPQGLFCLFALPVQQATALRPEAGILLCEDIQDPANLGAMLRSAAAFGFGGALLCGNCADAFSPRVVRASVGAVARMPLLYAEDFTQGVSLLPPSVTLWAAAFTPQAQPLENAAAQGPFALCIGNEGRGLSAQALAGCGQSVYIPMQNGVESLNAAVAAAVLMYKFKAAGIN